MNNVGGIKGGGRRVAGGAWQRSEELDLQITDPRFRRVNRVSKGGKKANARPVRQAGREPKGGVVVSPVPVLAIGCTYWMESSLRGWTREESGGYGRQNNRQYYHRFEWPKICSS